MSGDASVTLAWFGGEHTFRLAIGQLRMLQEKCGIGPLAIHDRLMQRGWMIDDVREVIRLGLIGGGMPPAEAEKLLKSGFDEQPLTHGVPVAKAILMAALVGVPGDPVGKTGAAKDATGTAATVSPSPPSTETEKSSD